MARKPGWYPYDKNPEYVRRWDGERWGNFRKCAPDTIRVRETAMTIEETRAYRCYLCLAKICGTLGGDNLGSDGYYNDNQYYNSHLAELRGADIDRVFHSQLVKGVFGDWRWAFTDPANGLADDLGARLFHDRDHDLYYLVNRPTETFDDKINDALTAIGLGVPDKFKQAAQLIELVKPQFRHKIVLSGFSLGGGLSAYAAIKASWPVRTIVFDSMGLNRNMMGLPGMGIFGQGGEVLSDRFRYTDGFVDWYYISRSWVARINVERHLSSIGTVTELPQDPVRAKKTDSHDLRHVRFGLHRLWDEQGWRGSGSVGTVK